MTDILFDLESKIREWLKGYSEGLGLQLLAKIPEAKIPEPETVEPPKQPTLPLQPPVKIYVEGSPQQRTNGSPIWV